MTEERNAYDVNPSDAIANVEQASATEPLGAAPVGAHAAATQPQPASYAQGSSVEHTAPLEPQQPAYQYSAQQQTYQQAAPQSAQSTAQQPYQQTAQQPFQQAAYQQAYQDQVYQTYAANAKSQHVKPQHAASKGGFGKTFAAGFAGAALAVVIGFGGFACYNAVTGGPSGTTTLGAVTSTQIDAGDEDPTLAEAVSEKVTPSVVSIDVYTKQSGMSLYFGGAGSSGSDDSLTETSLGSGVVISADGYILTNYHVIEGADALKATVNGEEYDADIVGSDSSSDIAVIKVDAQNLTPIEIGSSSQLKVGEWVMALGSPYGLENSVSVGIVSALQRSTTRQDTETGEIVIYPNMIQTDASINPGNSGGALVDSDGRLVGINSMITSSSGSSAGVGFAIPVDYAMSLAEQIIEGKTPSHAQLGISMAQINSQTAKYYNLATDTGVYVATVYDNGAAATADIQEGDIITAIDGKSVTTPSELMIEVRTKNPGDTVTVTLNRNGEVKDVEVTLGSDEVSLTSRASTNGYGNSSGQGGMGSLFGLN